MEEILSDPAAQPNITRPSSTALDIQVLGLCRFSVPSEGAFQVTHDTIEQRRAMLYEPARLDNRFIWFEHVLLPAIAKQKDPQFKLIILMGEDFPEPYRARMLAHIETVPQLCAEFAPPLHHRKICADAMAAHIDVDADVVAQFRLDDDDAVAVDFVHRLRRDARRAKGFVRSGGPVAIDYGKGILLCVDPDGAGVTTLPRLTRYWTPGLAVVAEPSHGKHILDYEHHKLWTQMTTITLVDEVMFVRGVHGSNDSSFSIDGPGFAMSDEEAPKVLKKRFQINLASFTKAILPKVKS